MTRSEVKFISTVSVSAIQRKADELAQEYRNLDTRTGSGLVDGAIGIGRVGSWRKREASTTLRRGNADLVVRGQH